MTRANELARVQALPDEKLEAYRHELLRRLADAAEEMKRRRDKELRAYASLETCLVLQTACVSPTQPEGESK